MTATTCVYENVNVKHGPTASLRNERPGTPSRSTLVLLGTWGDQCYMRQTPMFQKTTLRGPKYANIMRLA